MRPRGEAKCERTSGCAVITVGPLNVLIQSETIILRFLSQILTQKLQTQHLIGPAHSKDLTCVPWGSLVFGFASHSFISEKTSGTFQGSQEVSCLV